MSVVLVGSCSGSPGATTLTMALASSWPDGVVVEADWQGGRLAARFALARDPGIVTLAAARDTWALREHAQVLPAGLHVVVGPESGEAAAALWDSAGAVLATRISMSSERVAVDGGRLSSTSPVVAHVARLASVVMCVVRNDAAELAVAAPAVAALRRAGATAGLVLVGANPYGPQEVEQALKAPVFGVLPWDPAAAASISVGKAHRNLRASEWARAVRSLAERVTASAPAGDDQAQSPVAASR